MGITEFIFLVIANAIVLTAYLVDVIRYEGRGKFTGFFLGVGVMLAFLTGINEGERGIKEKHHDFKVETKKPIQTIVKDNKGEKNDTTYLFEGGKIDTSYTP